MLTPSRVVAESTVVPLIFRALPDAKSKCSELVQESVASTQLKVLLMAPRRVIPPPSAVLSLGEATLPKTIFLSWTLRVVDSIVVVEPWTVRVPVMVTFPLTVPPELAK